MTTNVKFLKEVKEGRIFNVLDAPYREDIVVTSVKDGTVTIEGTATMSIMSYFKMVEGLLDETSNFSEKVGERVCAICTKLNGTEITIKKADDEEAAYRQWKHKREEAYKNLYRERACKS